MGVLDDLSRLTEDARQDPPHEGHELFRTVRRRRSRRRLASGAVAIVAVLVAAGFGASQLVAPGTGDLEIADQPLPDQSRELDRAALATAERFGEGETEAGVAYSGRVRVDADDRVCVTLVVDGGSAESCRDPIDQLQATGRHVPVMTTLPTATAVAAWTPFEVDHVRWELPDGDEHSLPAQQIEGLPGSVYASAVDGELTDDSQLRLYRGDELVDRITVSASDSPVGEATSPQQPSFADAASSGDVMTDDGMHLAARTAASDDLLCVWLSTDDLRRGGCGLREQYLDAEVPYTVAAVVEGNTAVAGWVPPAGDHLDWSFPDEEVRLETVTIDGLPGRGFIGVVDGVVTDPTTVHLRDADGEHVTSSSVPVPAEAHDGDR